MTSKDKVIITVVLILGFLALNSWGIYTRNYKVDSKFLDVISEQMYYLDKVYIQEETFTMDDRDKFWTVLNSGAMNYKSNAEIEIAVTEQAMSGVLQEMSNERIKGNNDELKKKKVQYQALKGELKGVLEKYRNRNEKVDKLWKDKVF